MATHLALAFTEKELEEIKNYTERELPKTDKVVALYHAVFPVTGLKVNPERMSIKVVADFLSKPEYEKIEGQIAFFAKNWYRFDKNFEEKTTVGGISLGFVEENEISHLFRRSLWLLQAIINSFEELKPKGIIANRNGPSAVYARAFAAAKKFKNLELLDFERERAFMRYPNLTGKEWAIVKKKMPVILKKVFSGRKKAKETVFVRDRGYLGDLKQKMSEKKEWNVLSLDEFLMATLLNPFTFARYAIKKRRLRKVLSKIFEEYWSKQSNVERFDFEGIDFKDVAIMQLRQASQRDWPEFVFLEEKLKKLFEKEKPKVVVLWEDWVPFERICVLLAKKFGAKSLVLQHGIFEPITIKENWIHGFAPVLADKIAVWGEMFKQKLVKQGIEASKIEITGAPKFDRLSNIQFSKLETRKKLNLNQEKLVMIASNGDFDKEELNGIMGEVARAGNARLLIKLHPMEDLAKYDWVKEKAIVLRDENLYELLNIADTVVVKASTVGLEAMLLGKPVIAFCKKWEPDSLYESREAEKAVLHARNYTEFGDALKVVFDEKKSTALKQGAKDFAQQANFRQDSMATKRVISLVKSMIE